MTAHADRMHVFKVYVKLLTQAALHIVTKPKIDGRKSNSDFS